jgi:plastocyanin
VIKRSIAIVVGAAALAAVPGVDGATKKAIELGDNYYAPKTVTVAKNTTVTWRWPGFEEAGDVHDVKLKSGPKGVKKFQSESAATDYSFKRKLTVAGTYKIVCTLHEEMTMTIKVRR